MIQQLIAAAAGLMLLAGVGIWENGKLLSPTESERRIVAMTASAINKARERGIPIPDGNRARIALGSFNTDTGRPYIPPPNANVRTCRYQPDYQDSPTTVCDTEKCFFADGQICTNSTKLCHDPDGTLILDRKGNPVSDSNYYPYDWDESFQSKLCLSEDGTVLPPPGEKPYEERYTPNCSYLIVHPKYDPKITDSLITCDTYRCMFPGGGSYWRFDTKKYYGNDGKEIGKRPKFDEFRSVDWRCLDWRAAKKYEASYPYDNTYEEFPSGCGLIYKGGKHVYENCIYTYNEYGEQIGRRLQNLDEFVRELDRLKMIIGETLGAKNLANYLKRMGAIELKLYERSPLADEKKIIASLKKFNDIVEPFPRWPKKMGAALATLEREMKQILKK